MPNPGHQAQDCKRRVWIATLPNMPTPQGKAFYAPGASGPHTPIRAWVYIGIAISWVLLMCGASAMRQLSKNPNDVAGAIGYFCGSALLALGLPYAAAVFAIRNIKPPNWLSFSKWFFWAAIAMTVLIASRST